MRANRLGDDAICGATIRSLVLLVVLALSVAASATGQTNDEVHAGQQFSFAPPGARSMAMGGAFTGLADDATAAFANPAGLLWLRKPEVSIEVRRADISTRYPDGGSASGTPSLCGSDAAPDCADVRADLGFAETASDADGLAFLSYVHLFRRPSESPQGSPRFRETWRLAISRHELANYRSSLRSEGPFLGGPGTRRGGRTRLAAVDASYELRVVTTGLSLARQLFSGERVRLWGGLSLGWSTLELNSRSSRFRNLGDGANPMVRTGPADFSASNETNRQTQFGDDDAASGSVGLILRAADADWSLGAVYRRAPEFDIDYRFQWGPEAHTRAEVTGNPHVADPEIEAALSGTSVLRIPESWSVGGSLRLRERFRVSADYTRVAYSDLLPTDNVLLNVVAPSNCGAFTDRGVPNTPAVPCGVNPSRLARFAIDDGDEIHLGFEYVVGSQPKFALRVGAWLDPDHQLRYEVEDQLRNGFGESPIANATPPLDRLATRFLAGNDEVHWTAGLGFIPSRERLQFDLATDVSQRGTLVSLSAVYRW